MCFIADREKTLALINQKGRIATFKLARVVDGQLRAPWRDNTILGLDPFGSLGQATVTFCVPDVNTLFDYGDGVTVDAWLWLTRSKFPPKATAANGFYLSSSKEAIEDYVVKCGLPQKGLVLLPVSISSDAVEATDKDGSFILVNPYLGVSSMLRFVEELALIGDDTFIEKYAPGFEE